jgi:hypothetical protein
MRRRLIHAVERKAVARIEVAAQVGVLLLA